MFILIEPTVPWEDEPVAINMEPDPLASSTTAPLERLRSPDFVEPPLVVKDSIPDSPSSLAPDPILRAPDPEAASDVESRIPPLDELVLEADLIVTSPLDAAVPSPEEIITIPPESPRPPSMRNCPPGAWPASLLPDQRLI
jgi:hypothetical protein